MKFLRFTWQQSRYPLRAYLQEDAKLLTQESELIQSIQGVGIVDYDVDTYVNNLELFIKKKLKIYNLLNKKLG